MTDDPAAAARRLQPRARLVQFAADGSLSGRRGGGGLIAGRHAGLGAVGGRGSAVALRGAQRGRPRGRPAAPDGRTARRARIPVRMLDIPPDTFAAPTTASPTRSCGSCTTCSSTRPNQPHFDAAFRRDWAAYVAYNEAFADALAAGEPVRSARPGTRGRWSRTTTCAWPRGCCGTAWPAPTPADRALRAHPVGAAGLLPDAARTTSPSPLDGILGADHAGLPRRALGRRVPRLLRRRCSGADGRSRAAAGAAPADGSPTAAA